MNKEKPYSFWPSEAEKYGIEKAVILYNLRFWLNINRASGKERHYHDGKWWTYNTANAIEKLMPFFNRRSIARWLSELEVEGVLLSGVFNKVAYDRTKWYTIPSEFSDDAIGQNGQWNGHDGQSNCQNGQPIPDYNPVGNHDENHIPPNGSASSDDGVQCDLIPEDKETSKPEKPKKPRLNKPDNWKQFYAEYPANRRGGSDATPWEKAKKMRLTEDDFAAMLEDVKKRKLTESWRNGFVPGITKYLTEETWKVPLTWPVPSYQTNQDNTKVDVDAAMAPRAVRRQESTPEQLKRNQEQAANLLNMFKGG